ncbi:MAG: DNA-processing protein DprA [Candidatus Gracilibacteria bacterium]|nr:DNA-processing protein DprA [Candidatus Gracilibacteria bacterium]
MNEKVYLVALHKIGIEHKKLFTIFSLNQNYKDFFDKLDYELLSKLGYKSEKINSILKYKSKLDLLELEQMISNLDVKIITFFDENYPFLLKNIFNIPFLLYVRGNITSPGFAFIGSRNISSYGKTVIENFVPEIGKYFTIISGGAFGCDSYSHEISIKNEVKTISVIGTGIDINYPVGNKKLYDEIIEKGGAIISIFPFGEKGNPYNFPIRNEIVAGLSNGIFVVEAREKSGSLITAKLGLDLGKDIFTVPGDIFKQNSIGCNNLIYSSEAKMVLKPNDVLSEYNILNNLKNKSKISFNDNIEKLIYDKLLIEPLNIDEIAIKLDLEISLTLLKITILELSGIMKKNESGKYEII